MGKAAVSGKVITGIVRFSFASVFEPKLNLGDTVPKYSVQILIPKDDHKTLSAIEAAEAFALQQGVEKNKFGKVPRAYKEPLHDGDEEREEDENYAGFMYLTAKSNSAPDVVDGQRNPIIDPEDFYSGCWGHASITFYAYNAKGTIGVAVALNNVMKTHEGEPLGGKRASADQDFAVLDTEDFD
jgi:hypothetical protein